MDLSKGIPVQFGSVKGWIYGGPFRRYEPGTRRLVGVKMAEEIDHPHDISIPTEDFSVPDYVTMQQGLIDAVKALVGGNDIYAGCMGGIGRTGLFMGVMAKVMVDYAKAVGEDPPPLAQLADPVKFVRAHYKGHAIETQQQQTFVMTFPTEPVVATLIELLNKKEVVVQEVKMEVPVLHYPGLFEYACWWLSGGFLR